MVGNLTMIMQILIALCAGYLAENCPLFGEKLKTFFWAFSLTMYTVTILTIIIQIGEYWQIWG